MVQIDSDKLRVPLFHNFDIYGECLMLKQIMIEMLNE